MITQTWFKDHNTEEIDGTHAHHTFRLGRRSGGCSIYVENCSSCEPIGDLRISYETNENSTIMVT